MPPTTRIGDALADDGHRLTYRVDGDRSPTLLVHHGLLSSRQHWWPFIAHFSERARVVTWDYRGHGTTPPPTSGEPLSMTSFARDGHAVLRSARRGPAVLLGLSMGVQVVLEQYRAHPEDAQALVLLCGTYGHPLVASASARALLVALARAVGQGGPFRAALRTLLSSPALPRLAALSGAADPQLVPADFLPSLFHHVASLEPRVISEVVSSYVTHTAEDVLPQVSVPTLLIASDRDRLTPARLSACMQARIPGAELVVLPKSTHVAQLEYPERVHRLIERFLTKHHLLS